MSLPNIDFCPAGGGRVPRQSKNTAPAPAGSLPRAKAPLVAQIPDLDRIVPTVENQSAAPRVISQGLSRKLVVGTGVVLVVAAMMPFALKKKDTASTVADEVPAYRGDAAPTQANAPAWAGPGQNVANSDPSGTIRTGNRASPGGTPAYLSPEPRFGASRPTAPGEPGWPPAVSNGAVEATATPADYRQSPPADYRFADPAGHRPNDAAGQRRDYQADVRSDPATAFRGDRASEPRGDWRNESATGNGHPGGALQGNPLMPASPAAAATVPAVPAAPDQAPQTAEPGVARLEGTIASPSSEDQR
jgi:hypothetical protein